MNALVAQIAKVPVRAARVAPWSAIAFILATAILVSWMFWPTAESMIGIWRNTETFQHCFLVLPIVLWLVWNERARLIATEMRPFWPGLAMIVLAGAGWLFGVLSYAQVISHFALVAMIPAVVITVVGLRWAKVLWFPLLFLFFAVPFGEALVPKLMDWTADFTVAAVKLSGVPVYREGTHFVIPSGQWSVIEACSGIKFLIASLMGGSLYAWLMYRSPGRRLAFIGASIVVPLIANWLRAYIIVMAGHLSNNKMMTGDDHLVFGWILFAAIMLLMYWWGARWREDAPWQPAVTNGTPATWHKGHLVASAFAVATLAMWLPVAGALIRPVGLKGPAQLVAPVAQGGWQMHSGSITEWAPELDGASASKSWVFERDGLQVELFVAAFRHQNRSAQLGSSINQLVRSQSVRWKQTAKSEYKPEADGSGVPGVVRVGEVRGLRGLDHLMVWHWFYSRGRATTSEAEVKADVAWARIKRTPDTALWITLGTPIETDRAAAQRTLVAFTRDMAPSLASAFRESTLK